MKIISITNCHIFDGIEISPKAFENIVEALRFSRYAHTIEYLDEDGKNQIATVK